MTTRIHFQFNESALLEDSTGLPMFDGFPHGYMIMKILKVCEKVIGLR